MPEAAAPGWRARLRHLPIRQKLLAMVLLPLAVVLPLLAAILLAWGNTAVDRLLITKVRADLAVAHGYFERVRSEVGASAAGVADSHALRDAFPARPPGEIVPLLQRLRQREGVDFIVLRDAQGRVVATHQGLPAGDAAAVAPPPPRADARARANLELMPPLAFAAYAPDLLPRVAVPLVATRNAAPTDRTKEERALVLAASAPVLDGDGRLLGVVQAGVLLNRNLPFIDHINEIVYPEGSLPFGSRGTATLFLDDVRISTNVRLFGQDADHRAIGTRVSQTVREAVLGRGSTWLDRAFVVNDWYVSAYEPLADAEGRRVGMLYVGYLEQPFIWLKYGVLGAIGALFVAVMVAAALLSLRYARTISAPIELMADTMQRVEAGALDARVGPLARHDELGALAGHLDDLLDAIADKTAALQRMNAELDAKVEQRGRELQEAQQQLVRNEKLAAVGQLTASIAHEMNNPIAVIQGNLDLVRELLGASAVEKVHGELRLVDAQIERMRLIVTQLLQFARPTEFAGYVEPVDTAAVAEDCLVLVGHLLDKTHIRLACRYGATRRPAMNRNELQQVLVNLLVNAVQAMPQGGVLTVATRNAGTDAVEIEVGDTGPGLPEDLRASLFQPFVTRKKDGTGLGLWISRNLVERYGGDIRAANRTGGTSGAVFTVVLRTEAA